MTIHPIQLNRESYDSPNFKQEKKSYRDADGVVKTRKKVKPLPPKGHLVDDNAKTSVKYFFKDIGYDIKSVKDGIKGEANDHQLGRLNDVGLKLGGIGIAAYLASRTADPKTRLMEYIGLATFLTAMSIYPKLAINAPSKMVHGFDTGKEYIDDQGRKKSVFQDSNYIPYDMYKGENPDENLDLIGDKMGIPRDIHNRHDLIKAQMRKVATQNNTLWMLTAGFATPLMTALICNGLENYVIAPTMEATRNNNASRMIKHALEQSANIEKVDSSLNKEVEKILSRYTDKIIPKNEVENIINIITERMDSNLASGIKQDIEKILVNGTNNSYRIDENAIDLMMKNGKRSLQGRNLNKIEAAILPTKEEILTALKNVKADGDIKSVIQLNETEYLNFKKQLDEIISAKISKTNDIPLQFLNGNKANYINSIDFDKASALTKETSEKLINFAKIMGDFKDVQHNIDKCKSFKFEHAPDTILARYYDKFQKTLIKELNISSKDLQKIAEDKDFARKIFNEKVTKLCQDSKKYTKVFEELGGILTDMDKALHKGTASEKSNIADLISSIDNLYNNTAKRLAKEGEFSETIKRLVNEDVSTLSTTLKNNSIEALLEGFIQNPHADGIKDAESYLLHNLNGKGSSKNLEISRIISRYQGEQNSFYRTMHTLDFYKRTMNPESLFVYPNLKNPEYINELVGIGKTDLSEGNINDYILKFNMANSMNYRDLGYIMYPDVAGEYWSTAQKGLVTEEATAGLTQGKKLKNSNLLERFQKYITRTRNIVMNDKTDFTKPNHILNPYINKQYNQSARTNEAVFNLVGQSPIDMLQKGASSKFTANKWLKTVGIMTAGIFGITMLAQFTFGKIKSNHISQKKVGHDDNK